MRDLKELPKFRDGLSYLYVERCKIDQEAKAIALHNEMGKTPVPAAALAVLMLGPGTSITHAAVRTLADNGCLILWCGEEGVRFYAQGMGESRHAANLLRQARLASNEKTRLEVVMRLYRMRFSHPLDDSLTLQQIRGMEGIRVREAYAQASRQTGVQWSGRRYKRGSWKSTDLVNRALSAANACLYGVVHAGIVSGGYSPAIGFLHTGKMLSFVYDIADLYKVDITVPLAFREAAKGPANIERRIRTECRIAFKAANLMGRILPDIEYALGITKSRMEVENLSVLDSDAALPTKLWDPGGPIDKVELEDSEELNSSDKQENT